MSMLIFIFNHNHWEEFYSNCSLKTVDEWNAEISSNVYIGLIYMTLGVVFEISYIPILIVMARHEFLSHSCYKFMFMLGVIDMVVLPFTAILTGIQSVFRLHFCSNPHLFFIEGVAITHGYIIATITATLLAFNRFFEILLPSIANRLYSGKRIYIWLFFPFVCLILVFYFIPALYNPNYSSAVYDLGVQSYPEFQQEFLKMFLYTTIYNVFIVACLLCIYSILCIVITIKAMVFKVDMISKLQRIMFYQSLLICVEMSIVALGYTYAEYFPIPMFMLVFMHIGLICLHGDTPIVYLLLNQTLRKAVFEMFLKITKKFFKTNEQNVFYVSTTLNRVQPV